jgi:outer membrane lipoprotein carrier protein
MTRTHQTPGARPLLLVATAACVATGALAGPAAAASQAMDAQSVAARVQSFYERTSSVQAAFHQTYYHRLYDRYERSQGKVVFKKPGKMRWDYDRPNGKVIVSDGRRIQVFDPGQEGEVPQLLEQQLSQHQLPQAFSFLTGTGKLDEEFRFRLLDPAQQGFQGGHVLELRPKEPSPHYDRILFYVVMVGDGAAKAGVVRRVLIIDAAGNRNRFDFKDLQFDRPVPDARFQFQPPRGTRIVRN